VHVKSYRSPHSRTPLKAPTGILGFDEITGGGLPRNRTTLLLGGPGSGKTVFALQFLVHGARQCKEPGIFVAFEESAKRIVANAESFGWKLSALRRKKLYFMDAQPLCDMVQSGSFDLSGMLAALGAQTKAMGARRIVFDALDVVLALLPDTATKRREVYRLHEWLLERELSGLITAKAGGDEASTISSHQFGFMQFMVDCAVILNHSVVMGVSQRNLRVQKYRGTSFDENESPFLIGTGGLEVDATRTTSRVHTSVSNERVSSGVKRLDTMLGGGYYRGASVLITGFPGTAKTTWAARSRRRRAGAASARSSSASTRTRTRWSATWPRSASNWLASWRTVACAWLRRAPSPAARDVPGPHQDARHRAQGPLPGDRSDVHLVQVGQRLERTQRDGTPDRLVEGQRHHARLHQPARRVVRRKRRRLDDAALDARGHLDPAQLPVAGRRAQPRPVDHQVARHRALEPGARADPERRGVTLADTYSAGGEVLMGTLRWEKEGAERVATEVTEVAGKLKRVRLDAEEAELGVRVKSLQVELQAKQVEKALLARTTEIHKGELSQGRTRMDELRGADVAAAGSTP
jgi:circadian clock protein KaiC